MTGAQCVCVSHDGQALIAADVEAVEAAGKLGLPTQRLVWRARGQGQRFMTGMCSRYDGNRLFLHLMLAFVLAAQSHRVCVCVLYADTFPSQFSGVVRVTKHQHEHALVHNLTLDLHPADYFFFFFGRSRPMTTRHC